MLARSYTALSRFRDAAGAFRKAIDLLPPNPNLLADLADVTGMAQGKRLAGEPARLVQAALDLDPRHVKALALAGSVAFETRDYAAARGYWERLVAVLPPEAPMLRGVRGSIAEATRLETGAPATAAAAPPSADALQRAPQAATPAAIQAGAQGAPGVARVPTATTNATVDAGHAVRGEVTLSPALTARLAPEDTLFVVARAETGPRMPLAVHRVRVGSAATRFAFTLDDSLAMAPNAKLSAHSRVVVSARISRTGEATPRAGDLLSDSTLVAPGSQGLKLVIDRVQP
jgi:cytochrome c-type biogenesis protein CcmH